MFFFLFYFLLSPILLVLIHISRLFIKKIDVHLKDKKRTINNVIYTLSKINRSKRKVLLFHAASSGEFEQIKPILKQVNREKYFIIQTFSSPTIFNQELKSSLFDVCCYHPFDIVWQSYYFFKKLNPNAYIITRHDIWPAHLFVTKKLGIKSYYINANMHRKSLWNKKLLSSFSKSIFDNLYLCLVPSKDIKNHFSKIISINKIHVTGDSRFDQVVNRKINHQQLSLLPDYYKNSFNIIFGSYDKYDMPIMIESLVDYYPNGDQSLKNNNHRIILVPHEVDDREIKNTLRQLQKHSFKPLLYSKLDFNINQACNILIVNKVGILADLYKYTQLAYVGSGFNDGVHSVIEPGVYGNAISFGPNIELLDEAKYIYSNKIGFMIKNKNDMLNFFDLHKQKKLLKKSGKSIVDYINNNSNASQKINHWIERTL